LGFALSPDPAVSAAALVAITQEGRAGLVSNRVVDRLVRMRPWLSERRRAKIDTADRALRPKTAFPVPLTRWEIRSVLASLCDGAGAQSLFALIKRGRRFTLASLLVKTQVGVADAWVREGMTKAEADALIAQSSRQPKPSKYRSPSSSGGSPMPSRSMLHATSPAIRVAAGR
jgi:hypothetical protein